MKKISVSIVIAVIKVNDFLRKETIPALLKQTNLNFEIIIIPDKSSREKFLKTRIIPSWPKTGPADKRDLGVEKAKGEIIAFLDDDSYPDKDWLKNALKIFEENKKIAGVCGPSLTPPHNSLSQKASGYTWSTWLGSGGAGNYRCTISNRREVDDYPTVNLLVRKKDFLSVGGFDSHFWPGEDTKLCHDLTYKLGKKIIYDPKVLVYHHRRAILNPHLQQIGRYAVHRGHFARILPKTSLRFGYLAPSFFVLFLFGGPFLIFLMKSYSFEFLYLGILSLYLSFFIIYLVCLIWVFMNVFLKEKNFKLAFLSIFTIFITHVFYGILFIKGFFLKKLSK
jgi:GT2 family glycosyltransferase